MTFRRRTLWFRELFGEMVPERRTPDDWYKAVLVLRTMRGVWGETW